MNYLQSIINSFYDSNIKNKNIYIFTSALIIINDNKQLINGCSFFYPNSDYYICFDSSKPSQFYIGKCTINTVIATFPFDSSSLPPNFSLLDLYNHLSITIYKFITFQ